MSDNYLFKGTSISSITYVTGGVNGTVGDNYTGFPPTVATNYSQSKPLDLGYEFLYNNLRTAVSNICTAMYKDSIAPETIIPPIGVKKFRYLILGGGGSGGGYGGDAKSNQGDGTGSSTGNGGDGGLGGYSAYTVGELNYGSGTINVSIGTGGSIGTNGTGNSTKGGAVGQPTNTATGNNGNSNPGNESSITFNSVKYSSAGGTRGLNGNGASAKAAWGNSASVPGTTDSSTNYPSYRTSNSIPVNWPPLGGTYGQGGSGGINANSTPAKAGGNGISRIIWLYE